MSRNYYRLLNKDLLVYFREESYSFVFVWLVLLLILCSLIPTLLRAIWKRYVLYGIYNEDSRLPIPPGSLGYPFIGETLGFVRKGVLAFYEEKLRSHGNIYKTHILGVPTVRISGAENIRKLLTVENSNIVPNWPESVKKFLGKNNILHSTGSDHKFRRRQVARAFSSSILFSSIPTIQDVGKRHLQHWLKLGEMLAVTECRKLALEINWNLVMGLDFREFSSSGIIDDFLYIMENLFTLPIEIPGFVFHKSLQERASMHSSATNRQGHFLPLEQSLSVQ
ncbi:hypothetical protein ScPMuIL_001577 [Solemya velum]